MDSKAYYRLPAVRARIKQYVGGARYVTNHRRVPFELADSLPVECLPDLLDEECELSRSLCDQTVLVAHLDLEHVHFDRPEDTYLNPWLGFTAQQPLVTAIQEVLAQHGLAALHLLSGRGHHFVWSLPLGGAVFTDLMSERWADRRCGGPGTSSTVAAAHSALGCLMEYLAHEALRRANCVLPIGLGAVECPPSARGREMLSVDLSEYGDPLAYRAVRVPFSLYLKPRKLLPGAPAMAMIPAFEMDLSTSLQVMRDLEAVAELAGRTVVRIPEQEAGTASLLAAYRDSSLARVHDDYQREPLVARGVALDGLPPCVRQPLEQPNDRLLKPAVIQHLVRYFLSVGWHPRHVAGVILGRYLADEGWVRAVHYYDPGLRADFYTRLYASALLEGLDELADYDCAGLAQKGYCPQARCGHELADLRLGLARALP